MTVSVMVLLARLSLAAEAGDFDSFEALLAEIRSVAGEGDSEGSDLGEEIEREIAALRTRLVNSDAFRAENERLIAELSAADAAGEEDFSRSLVEALHRRSEAIMASVRPFRHEATQSAEPASDLFQAIDEGNLETVCRLLPAVNVNARHGANEETALYYALNVEERSVAMVEALLEAGADPNAGMADNYTPLHAVSGYSWGWEPPERTALLAHCLVEAGANVEARTATYGWTPLQRAVMEGSAQQVEALLRVGADPNLPYGERSQPWFSPGRLPLEIAARDVAKVRLLLEYGADPKRRDERGESILGFIERTRMDHVAHGAPDDEDDAVGLKASIALIRGWPARS